MTVKELYHYLEERFPRSLSAEWDNDGLSCCPDPGREVRRVLVALDLTEAVAKRAADGGFDVVLTHHPLLFRGVKALVPEQAVPRKLLTLARAGVAAMAFHTRLDAAEGGVNDILAALLGLSHIEAFGPAEEVPCGRVGELPEAMAAEDLAAFVKNKLHAPGVLLSGRGLVRRVAVLGGEGGDYVAAAAAAGADLFLSGRIGYHRMLDGPEEGIALLEAGHHATEAPVCAHLADLVQAADSRIAVEVMPTDALCLI
ncbi:MAG: Nif3-like dinuclear metal center hexameric protein [Ruminococcaceae bacterium]|nr:Nif3-like dinuclear metal center hexameric protein [Oscillospiraceae bacterium]